MSSTVMEMEHSFSFEMNSSKHLGLLAVILLLSIGVLSAIKIQTVRASGTVYIRADGSIDPPTAPISTTDNVNYTLTGNIDGSVVVERDNIVVDGEGYIVHGTGNGTGIHLSGRSNVTVKNMEVRAFQSGIRLDDSSNNTVSANIVTNNEYGIVLYHSSSRNTLRDNDASDNRYNMGVFVNSVSGFIQDIDDSNTVNGKPVYYWVNRRDMAVPLDAGHVVLVNCTRITVRGLSLANNMQGVALAFTTNSIITNNTITNNFDGIRLDYSSNNNVISGNSIAATSNYGIRLFHNPSTNAMSRNNVVKTEYASELYGPPSNNIIHGNSITDNRDGIRLDYSSNNTISANNVAHNWYGIGIYGSSSSTTVSGNNIMANKEFGIWFHEAYNNQIYHNNFIGNTVSVYPSFYLNFWDAGYPSGGNYWSHYHLTDIYSGLYQNEAGSDGIGDTPYVDDNYPLMGMFSDFDVTQEYHVQTVCNSAVSDFRFNGGAIKFNVNGADGTTGFCRVCIPTNLMNASYRVFVNGTEVICNLLPCSNSTHSYLYFNYNHSTQQVTIIPPSTIVVPDDYSTVQEAVNNASDGGTIFVKAGTYYEHVVVNKTVSLVGENRDTTIIDGIGTGHVIEVTSDNVNIAGFTVQNGGSNLGDAGVYLENASLCSMSENHISDNFAGIWLEESSRNLIAANDIVGNMDDGIVSNYSHNNTVYGNHIAFHEYFGIVINWSHNNTISCNNVTQTVGPSHGDGINLWRSSYNSIFQNQVEENNRYGIRIEVESNNNTLTDNKIGNCLTGLQVYNYSNYNDIRRNRVTNCSNGIELNRYITYTILSSNTIENSEVGININTWSVNNTISRNCLAANAAGIRFYYANLNEVFLNNITDSDVGATIQYSQSNMLYSNNFMNNTQQASVSIGYANAWDSGYPDGGNYWSDYSGLDQFSGLHQNVTGSDGIGDTPYVLDSNNVDRYPLVRGSSSNPADLNGDGKVDIIDVAMCSAAFGSYSGHAKWNPAADVDKDGKVDIRDIAIVAMHFGEANPRAGEEKKWERNRSH